MVNYLPAVRIYTYVNNNNMIILHNNNNTYTNYVGCQCLRQFKKKTFKCNCRYNNRNANSLKIVYIYLNLIMIFKGLSKNVYNLYKINFTWMHHISLCLLAKLLLCINIVF